MTFQPRLSSFLTRFLAVAPLAGCHDLPFVEKELDDVACLSVDLGASCPDEATAETQLIGTQTCTSPVREVVATGAFLSSEDVVYTGYGGYYPWDTGAQDTGMSEPQTRCCYEAAYKEHPEQSCVIGRPLVIDGRMVSACLVARAGWAEAPAPDPAAVAALSPEARAALADAWSEAGLLEHASIPAFARVSLDLVALGAPAELVARTAQAMSDEVVHATACFALASAYAGQPVGPGALPVGASEAPGLVRLAVEAFREGCVGETMAVALAAAQLREATDPAVRAVLSRIVEDEAQHAGLAWDIVRWAIAAGGEEVRLAVASEVERLTAPTAREGLRPAGTGEHGIADPASVRLAVAGMLEEVVAPCARELLAA